MHLMIVVRTYTVRGLVQSNYSAALYCVWRMPKFCHFLFKDSKLKTFFCVNIFYDKKIGWIRLESLSGTFPNHKIAQNSEVLEWFC